MSAPLIRFVSVVGAVATVLSKGKATLSKNSAEPFNLRWIRFGINVKDTSASAGFALF
jgi:hypothetical protein